MDMASGMGFLSVGASIFSALQSIEAGKQQKTGFQNQASVARDNATISEYQGDQRARTLQLQGEHVMGQAQAGFAAGGVQSSGSVLDVEGQIADESARNVANAHLSSKLAAMRFQDQAAWDEYQGKLAVKSGYTSAVGTLLGAGAKYTQTKMPSSSSVTGTPDAAGGLSGMWD